MILDSLDLITIVVPPSLPAALSTAVTYSKSRLMRKGIFCISPSKINLFGKLKLMCFDKVRNMNASFFVVFFFLFLTQNLNIEFKN